MHKRFTTPEYKKLHRTRLRKLARNKRKYNRSFRTVKVTSPKKRKKRLSEYKLKPILFAPVDFRLIENTNEVLNFFTQLRGTEFLNNIETEQHIEISLSRISHIDYGTISILVAISDDMWVNRIVLKTDFPECNICKKFLLDSGFLDHFVDQFGRKFPKFAKSNMVYFEKGTGYLSVSDQRNISILVSDALEFLKIEDSRHLPLKTIIKEICGNSIEHSGSNNKLWLFGVRYDTDKVTFTVTDIGLGILETLHFKFRHYFTNLFNDNLQILQGAFDAKYGSSTKEVNRNKGLPAIKSKANQGIIKNLTVLTNDVILHFDTSSKSECFGEGVLFRGTFYQWELLKDETQTIE